MSQLSPLEKETQFIYNKHNKRTDYPLEIQKIDFPKYIIKILEKTTARTKVETKKLTAYRNRVLYDLESESRHLQYLVEQEKYKKRRERQEKLVEYKDKKYQNDSSKIKHFGIWFENDERIKLDRNTYAKIDKKVHIKISSFSLEYYQKNPVARKQIFDDEYCTVYCDDWCDKHRQNCLKNFDLNVSFCDNLDKEKFEKALSLLLKKRKNFTEIYNVNECAETEGIYILVLDYYKQIYIGQSKDIKKRILQHWRKKKEFDRLLFGSVETSVLSIDAFGCLDTTRIFVLKADRSSDIYNIERILVDSIDKKYLLNRTAGGINGADIYACLEIIANKNMRDS